MIPYDSVGIVLAIIFCLAAKFLCYLSDVFSFSMYNKRQDLGIIPEKNEIDEERVQWVPKKKHEVLKAKYKCLKKLFQVYDASVIGILPESYEQDDNNTLQDDGSERNSQESHRGSPRHHQRRKKRSYRTKTDASAGTSGDVSVTNTEKDSVATTMMRDRELKAKRSCSTQMGSEKSSDSEPQYTEKTSLPEGYDVRALPRQEERYSPHGEGRDPSPYAVSRYLSEHRKPTRFQLFLQRLFGLRGAGGKHSACGPGTHVYAASDNMHYWPKRRRAGLRFRRLRKTKKIHSELSMREMSPALLEYVHHVQRSCLMDRTPRPCPMGDCQTMFYGIINYNDHLNLCHFRERKYTCLYCHEGFESEKYKLNHETEHLGLQLQSAVQQQTDNCRQSQKSSDTQTDPEPSSGDVPDDIKLKKIVSFFDKIVDNEDMINEMKNKMYSESNLQSVPPSSQAGSDSTESSLQRGKVPPYKRIASCGDLFRKSPRKGCGRQPSTVQCHLCGEDFDYRQQLSQHVVAEHGSRLKPSKFHSCAGIDSRAPHTVPAAHAPARCRNMRSVPDAVKFEAGKINIQSPDNRPLVQQNSEETVSCDPSLECSESQASVKRPGRVNNFIDKVQNGIINYRWEPGTKIIRV